MAKPSAVTEIETIPYSVRVWKMCVHLLLCVWRLCALAVCVCEATFVRVLHAEETEKKCAMVAYHIIKKNE